MTESWLCRLLRRQRVLLRRRQHPLEVERHHALRHDRQLGLRCMLWRADAWEDAHVLPHWYYSLILRQFAEIRIQFEKCPPSGSKSLLQFCELMLGSCCIHGPQPYKSAFLHLMWRVGCIPACYLEWQQHEHQTTPTVIYRHLPSSTVIYRHVTCGTTISTLHCALTIALIMHPSVRTHIPNI